MAAAIPAARIIFKRDLSEGVGLNSALARIPAQAENLLASELHTSYPTETPMLAAAIRFILMNLPSVFFVLALLIAYVRKTPQPAAYRYLSWLLVLAVGADMLWAGLYHVFLPNVAASFIGWQDSPFQFEIGVADIAAGIVAVVSFWRGLEFKTAVVWYVVLFYVGVAIGHVRQAVTTHNFAPGNFGMLFLLTVVKAVLLTWLLLRARRDLSLR